MTLDKVYDRLQENTKKSNAVDGRRFNSRSREKMQREIALLKKVRDNQRRKKASTKHLFRGLYSQDEIELSREEKTVFLEESSNQTKSACTSVDSVKQK